ncbi:ketoacyl-ACP synthase III family protein [Streptomyces pristinaespiralis]|uniref:ketoacyl-ACP synthase III family protein n=1 Tax=Streptomyces pristinaespiralis TaxID=38300 RepID=UPI003835E62A
MRHDDIHLAATGAWHPKTVPVDEAVADGRYSREYQRATGQQRVAVCDDDADSQPAMAIRAARAALGRSGIGAERFGLLLHAVATHNGLPGWNAASYLQHHVLDGHGVSLEIHQLSNSAVAALELACTQLAAGPAGGAAMITAADRFGDGAWDRWRAAPPVFVFGDGASAAVVTRGEGFARIVATVSVADTGLEGMQRGAMPFSADPRAGYPIGFFDRVMEFSDTLAGGLDEAKQRMADLMRRAGAKAMAEAGITADDVRWVAGPALGREALYEQCLDPLGIDIDRSTWPFARRVGHVGCTDQLAALDDLIVSGAVEAGDTVLVAGLGGGYNCTVAVLEFTATPDVPAVPEAGECR